MMLTMMVLGGDLLYEALGDDNDDDGNDDDAGDDVIGGWHEAHDDDNDDADDADDADDDDADDDGVGGWHDVWGSVHNFLHRDSPTFPISYNAHSTSSPLSYLIMKMEGVMRKKKMSNVKVFLNVN